MMKRIIALLLALILTVGLLPTVALAAKDQGTTTPAATATLNPDKGYYKFDGKPASESNADITLSKTAKLNDNGTYTVTLTATAKEKVTPVKTKVVFVLDASGSMNYCTRDDYKDHNHSVFCGGKWNKCNVKSQKHIHAKGSSTSAACSLVTGDYKPAGQQSAEQSRWAIATSAISTMVSSLPAGVETSFVYFTGDYAYTAQSANYTGVTPNNGTPLTAGLNKGIDQFKDSDATNRVIILVADGETSDTDFWGNTVYPTKAANRFKNGDGTIYTVGFTFSSKGFHSLSSGKDYQKNANNAGALNGALTEIREKIVGMISDPMGEMVTLDKSSVNVDKTASTATTTTTDTKIEWTDTAGLDGTVTLTYDVSLKPEVTERAGVKTIDLNGNATFNYSYKQGNTTVSKSLSFPQPTATVYVASLDVKYRLESETGTEVNVVATSEISGTSHEVKQLPYTFEAKLPAEGDTVTANGKTYYVKSVTGATTKANTPLEATVANANAHTITVVLTETAPTASYKVEHYKQNVEGTFPATADETEENLTGSTGTTATATPKTYPGFTCDESVDGTIKSGTIKANGSLVLKLYYTRNTYTVTFKDGANGAVFEDETQQVEYGKAIPSHADPVRPGYNFTGWTSEPANYQPGTGTMPANNITFTAQWTEKTSVTINYFAKTGGTVAPPSETLNPDTGTAKGSTATAGTGYAFAGWYSDPECNEAKRVGSNVDFTPTKPTTGWVDGMTFYAKFTKNTYTVTYTDGVNGTAFGDQSTPDVAYGAPIPAFNGTPTRAGYNFTGWTSSVTGVTTSSTMPDSNVTFTAGWAPKNKATINYEVVGPANCGRVTPVNEEVFVDAEKASGSTATAEPNYRFVGWYSDSECTEANKVSGEVTFTPPKPGEGGWVTTTYYAKFVPSTVTFDLNTLITKKFEAAADSKPIPDGSYTFKAEIVEADSSFGELVEGAKYEGTVTLNAADTASFDFGDDRYLKLAAGPHYYRVSEIGDTVTGTTGTITYDSRVFCLKIVVNDDGEVGSVNVTPLVVVYSTAEEAVEFEGDNHITFTNTYFEKKDPNSVTVDFSQYVRKHLTVTGDKSFNGATFTVNFTDGTFIKNEKENEPKIASIEVYAADAGVNERGLPNLTASVTYGADERDAGDKPFDGADLTIRVEGTYFYLVSEVIPDGATGYDTNEYIIGISVENDGDHLKVARVGYSKYIENSQEDPVITWNEGPTFHNTIDTGKDDYYPIIIPTIIPTIINKDTGMLNKTDHFAYVIGYPDGTVHPNGQITRAEVATIFFRLLRDEVRDGAFTTSNSYSDVAYGKWYNNPISTMSALGIITGYPDGTFKPNKPITRAEFAAIAARFDETQSGKSATFSDVIGHWAAKEIGIAYANEWIKGYPDGTFKPDQNITRAEAMTMINRVLERKPESPADLLTNMNKWTDNMDTSKWYYLDVQEATNSHGYTRKTFNYELWRQMLNDPDWSRYER